MCRPSAEGCVTALAVRPSAGPGVARYLSVRTTAVWAGCLAALLAGACAEQHPESAPAAQRGVVIGIPSPDAPLGPLVQSLTQLRLIRTDIAGRELPGLISAWRVSADRRTWWFTVRGGVRLHTGTAATAAHVASRIQAALDATPRLPGLWTVMAVDATDVHTVEVRLREPTSLLLEGLSLVAVPAGPYALENPEVQTRLRAVPQQGERPPAAGVELRRYDTPRAAVAALLRDEIDVLYEVPSESRDLLQAEEGIRIYPHLKPYVFTLGLNHRHPVLKHRAVRQALNIAIDRAALIEQEAGGAGAPAAHLIWREHWSGAHGTEHAPVTFDRARARALLDEAGFHEHRAPDGSSRPRFALSCLVMDEPLARRLAVRLQRAYAEIGVALELQALELAEADGPLAQGRFDTVLTPLGTGYGLSVPYQLFGAHDQPRLIDFGYTAAAAASERVRDAANSEALGAAVRDLRRVLLDDPPAVALFWQETSRAVGRRWRVPADVEGDVLGSLPRWTRTGA